MKYKEFLQYLEENLDGYGTFMQKAREYQEVKNQKRPAKKRWIDEKVEAAAYDMWKKSMENLYNTLKQEIKSDSEFAWTEFIVNHSVLEGVNEGITELVFDEVS